VPLLYPEKRKVCGRFMQLLSWKKAGVTGILNPKNIKQSLKWSQINNTASKKVASDTSNSP
jgi:hypothetical protein